MAESTSKLGPNASDASEETTENGKVFGYNVANEAVKPRNVGPNPNSPLAAG